MSIILTVEPDQRLPHNEASDSRRSSILASFARDYREYGMVSTNETFCLICKD